MKLGVSHYGHKSIPDAKFESGSSSSFGDMASQNFPRKNGTSHQITYPRKTGLTLKKWVVQNRSFIDQKIDPHVNFSNFQAEENFSFCKFLGHLNEKRAKATPLPLIDQFW